MNVCIPCSCPDERNQWSDLPRSVTVLPSVGIGEYAASGAKLTSVA
jgi:hypothetical protein